LVPARPGYAIKSAIVAKKSKNFHAKTQSRKGTAKKSFAGSLRLRVFACAFDFLFGCGSSALG